MKRSDVSRRIFLMGASAAVAGCATGRVPSLTRMGYRSPSNKLNVAAIGAGGQGNSDIHNCQSENVVALCDVDLSHAATAIEDFPKAKTYTDFRVMLERQKDIDAVTISTPDHMHTYAAITAMQHGKHVYVQKPLTHTIYEARLLTAAAQKYKVATQMGNQGHSGEGVRHLCEMIWSGVIGQVREAHTWSNRPIWPQGILEQWTDGVPRLLPEEPVPAGMDWDMWIGPAAWRPYNSEYAPFKWRGWWEFGTGALGDMGCHIMDPVNWALQLGPPSSVECVSQEGGNELTAPSKAVIRYEFPERNGMAPLVLYWHDGGNMPPHPAGIDPDVKLGSGDNGSLYIGDKGIITADTYGANARLLPDKLMEDYEFPKEVIPRVAGHHQDWIQSCKGGVPSSSNFNYSGPFTETVLLGNLCLRCEGILLWDADKMRVTNNKAANQFVKVKYRKGWEISI